MKGSKRVITNLPKEEWVPIEVPELAVIDKAAFERARERKLRNKEFAKRNKKRNYLMSGHFRCGNCGQVMTGYQLRGCLYYQCKTKHPKPNQKTCATANKSIIAHRVDDLVWDWICVLLTDDVALEDGLNKMIENNRDETGTKRNRLETIKNLIEKRKHSTERLVSELAEGEYSDEFTRGIFQQKINENTEVVRELEKERDRLEAELAQVELTEDFRREIKAMAAPSY
jgi:hypothetical protein